MKDDIRVELYCICNDFSFHHLPVASAIFHHLPRLDSDLKSLGGNSVPVQVRPAVPKPNNPNRTIHRIGDGFGFVVWFE